MKLRNKRTGEIGIMIATENAPMIYVDGREPHVYESLSELCEEWEDCKKCC